MTKLLSSIPVRGDREPAIFGVAIDLSAYLAPINDPRMMARIGAETEVYADSTFQVTRGESFRCRSATTQAMRYLYHEAGKIVGCLNITHIGRETVASNIVVRDDMQRRGIATRLVQRALEDFPHLVADDSMSIAGAALFGRLPADARAALEAAQNLVSCPGASSSEALTNPERRCQ